MKFIITLIIIGIVNTSIAQTKDDTKIWLSYHLDKYFGSDYDKNERVEIMKGKWWSKDKKYSYNSFVYSFEGNYLLIREENREMDSTGYSIVKNYTTKTINLKRIVMVEPEIDTIDNRFIGVDIKFKEADYDKKENIIEYSILKFDSKGKPLTEINNYALNFHLRSKSLESIRSRIEIKLAKSLLRLAKLNGAKIVKDLF